MGVTVRVIGVLITAALFLRRQRSRAREAEALAVQQAWQLNEQKSQDRTSSGVMPSVYADGGFGPVKVNGHINQVFELLSLR